MMLAKQRQQFDFESVFYLAFSSSGSGSAVCDSCEVEYCMKIDTVLKRSKMKKKKKTKRRKKDGDDDDEDDEEKRKCQALLFVNVKK